MSDLRHAFRTLFKYPGVTVAAMTTIDLGVGFNTAIFNAVYAVVLRPVPVEGLDHVIVIQSDAPGLNLRRFPLNPSSVDELNGRHELFDGVGDISPRNLP